MLECAATFFYGQLLGSEKGLNDVGSLNFVIKQVWSLDTKDTKEPSRKCHESNHSAFFSENGDPILAVLARVHLCQPRCERKCQVAIARPVVGFIAVVEIALVVTSIRWIS